MLTKLAVNVPVFLLSQAVSNLPKFDDRFCLNEPTGDFFYSEWKIKKQFQNTTLGNILNSLPFPIGEARVIKLEPGENYLSHADIDDRWHLTLSGANCFLIDLDNKKMYPTLPDGHWYEMDAGRLHTAANFGSTTRYQLVVRKPLTQTCFTDTIKVTIEPTEERHDYRYHFDNVFSPWLNQKNKQGLMKDFKHDGRVVSFSIHKSQKKQLEKIAENDFKVTYE